jgi:hypothetical protein
MKIRDLLTFSLVIFVFCAASVSAQALRGLLLTVNSTADSRDALSGDGICADANGRCTLRAAVEETNSNATRDAIIFDLPHPSVIELTFGELFIVQSLDIVGPGARRLTIQRAAGTINSRIIHTPQTQILVNIRSLTVRGGNDLFGGGVFVESGGVVGLYDSVVTGNTGSIGGGIMSSGKLTIVRCLISSNTASTTGGAIAQVGSTHEMTITNSTITGNTGSSAGAIYNEGSLLLVNDTISGNTGTQAVNSILSGGLGTIRVLNTIIGRDTALGNSLQGAFQSAGNNIVTDANGSTGFTNGVNGDQVSNNDIIDPLLGPLADNGGQTDTQALLASSPAIKNGNACARTAQCPLLPGITFPTARLDQRRFRRNPIADKIDVGAFDTDSLGGSSIGSLGLLGIGSPATRYTGSLVMIVNPATMERRYTMVRTNGNIVFTNLPGADAYVIEFRSKRSGILTPLVFAFD